MTPWDPLNNDDHGEQQRLRRDVIHYLNPTVMVSDLKEDVRPKIVEKICAAIALGKNLVLVRGAYRIGKSTATQMALQKLAMDDGRYTTRTLTLADFGRNDPDDPVKDSPETVMAKFRSAILNRDPSKRLVVRIDNVMDVFEEHPDVIPLFWKTISSLKDITFLMDFHYNAQHEADYFQSCPEPSTVWIGPLNREETGNYLARLSNKCGFGVSQESAAAVFAATGGRPYEIRILLQQFVVLTREAAMPIQNLSPGLVDGVTDVMMTGSGVFTKYFRFFHEHLSEDQRRALKTIADSPGGIPSSTETEKFSEIFVPVGWVDRGQETRQLTIRGKILRKLIQGSLSV